MPAQIAVQTLDIMKSTVLASPIGSPKRTWKSSFVRSGSVDSIDGDDSDECVGATAAVPAYSMASPVKAKGKGAVQTLPGAMQALLVKTDGGKPSEADAASPVSTLSQKSRLEVGHMAIRFR